MSTRRNGRVTKKALFKTVSQYDSCEPPFVPTSHARVGSALCPHHIVPTSLHFLPPIHAADIKDQKRLDALFDRFDTDRSPCGVEKSTTEPLQGGGKGVWYGAVPPRRVACGIS